MIAGLNRVDFYMPVLGIFWFVDTKKPPLKKQRRINPRYHSYAK